MSLSKINEQLQKLHNQYQVLFAGHPRISRDASVLDAWLAQLSQITKEAILLEEDQEATMKLIEERSKLYQNEAAEIRKLQKLSPIALASYSFGEWLDFSFQRYRRHFAGKSRNTRDLNLLSELTAELKIYAHELKELLKQGANPAKSDLENFQKNIDSYLKLYESEKKEIQKAQNDDSFDNQAGILANLANQCFENYRMHFQGKPRASRRLSTLERICLQLGQVHERMKKIPSAKLSSDMRPVHAKNMEIVKANLDGYQAELPQIENAQNSLNVDQWVSNLALAADQCFQAYRDGFSGKPRVECDANALAHICDELLDVLYQLKPLLLVVNADTSTEVKALLNQSLRLSMDQLRLFHREWEEITLAKNNQKVQ